MIVLISLREIGSIFKACSERNRRGERKGFADLSELVVYLEALISEVTDNGSEALEK